MSSKQHDSLPILQQQQHQQQQQQQASSINSSSAQNTHQAHPELDRIKPNKTQAHPLTRPRRQRQHRM